MTDRKPKDEPKESPADPMADAPPERPYSEAITDDHRKFLGENGIVVE